MRFLALADIVDRETGREWVEHELSKSEYSANDLTPLERLGQWFQHLGDSILRGALSANSPWLLIVVVLVIAGLVALIVWRVRRAGMKKTLFPVSDFEAVLLAPDPEAWRTSARVAAEAGDLRSAVIDQARAIFAVLAYKQIVSLDAALTASELSRLACAEIPQYTDSLTEVARVFNDVSFGNDPSGYDLPGIYTQFRSFDETLSVLPSRHSPVHT